MTRPGKTVYKVSNVYNKVRHNFITRPGKTLSMTRSGNAANFD